jgi:hypothetical protein
MLKEKRWREAAADAALLNLDLSVLRGRRGREK